MNRGRGPISSDAAARSGSAASFLGGDAERDVGDRTVFGTQLGICGSRAARGSTPHLGLGLYLDVGFGTRRVAK